MRRILACSFIVVGICFSQIGVFGQEFPFEVGDSIGFEPIRSDRLGGKGFVKEIKGNWFYVEAKAENNGSGWGCWYNSSTVQSVWVIKRAKKDNIKN